MAGMKDVARLAGVSPGTVSNVLNRPEPLTTVAQPARRPGSEAAPLLIAGEDATPDKVFEPPLVVRSSTRTATATGGSP